VVRPSDPLPTAGHIFRSFSVRANLLQTACAGSFATHGAAGRDERAPLRVRSQLRAVGLPELLARDLADYEARALRVARNPKEPAAIRARLAVNRRTQPLFDMARNARDFENRLLHVAHEHAQGQRG